MAATPREGGVVTPAEGTSKKNSPAEKMRLFGSDN